MDEKRAKRRTSLTDRRTAKLNRRREIIAATERLIQSHGLAVVTTRQISREVGCSEGALYVHFKNRVELLRAVMEEALRDALKPVKGLEAAIGARTPQTNLADVIHGFHTLYNRVIPMAAGLFAEPELLAAYREPLVSQNRGPHLALGAIARYIRSEQTLGRIPPHIDADLAATVLMSSAFFRTFSELFFQRAQGPAWNQFVKRLVEFAIGAL